MMGSLPTQRMKVLLIGQGGREHALAWKLNCSPSVEHVYALPGNGGTSTEANVSNIDDVAADDYREMISLSRKLEIGLAVVGPDQAVVDGIEGYFRDSGIPCFAPSKEAAEIEGSKAFAKDFMKKYEIPTAAYGSFDSYERARSYLDNEMANKRVVIKVDGLAAGKGVVLPKTSTEAHQALKEMMVDSRFGAAGTSVVIEEYMDGDEIGVLTFCDGKTTKSLPVGQDHKRIFDDNEGPNTGGMGVYSPVPFVTTETMIEIERGIIRPTVEGLQAEGRTFIGILFTGVMLTSSGPKVLEYNARFGDPETQTMMMLLSDDGLAAILLACARGTLDQVDVKVVSGFACNVVIAASGYPEIYRKGDTITFTDLVPEGVQVFHCGTQYEDGVLKTAGGRVLSVAASGSTLEAAVANAYRGVEAVHFDGMYYRKDIAARCLE